MQPRQLALELPHSPALTAADFVVSDGNALAIGHIRAFPDWPVGLTVIVGPPKSGKTHLADIWSAASGARRAWPENAAEAVPGGDPLVLEDVDRAPLEETALFNLLNQATRGERAILVTARLPVGQWPYQTEDVRSRLRLAAMFEIAPLDDALLTQMFAKLFRDRQVNVDPDVVRYLVERMERSPAEAVALVELADRIALSKGR
ncbi:MAG TPA: chromosomal replication initiator DnaA, partial [Devosiaceae bacterium]|nr:chromosomal replication initiator DnaA [Devosiaceae bacterium]